MVETTCGCRIVYPVAINEISESEPLIVFCPTHVHAFEFLVALQRIEKWEHHGGAANTLSPVQEIKSIASAATALVEERADA